MARRAIGGAWLAASMAAAAVAAGADVPTPEQVIGFRPGADSRLVTWAQVVDYFRRVDAASDRVQVRELGRTTEGRPYLVAIVSRPETMARLEYHRAIQRKLADPRLVVPGDAIDPAREGKAVALITCSIHSTETASTHSALDLLHGLAAGDDTETREILDGTILLLVPSANPDGVDKVAAWYERSKGTPWEGSGMPELYHKYAGHDTNRDWFMQNLQETRLLSRLLYDEWLPSLTYDVHEMGPRGARMFVPPFFDPNNPNLDPRVTQGIALVGAHMAADLAAAGKKGILTNAMYDNWWNGGNRTVPQRHNMVGVLTESASVKLASPIFVERDQLRGATRGFADHRPAVNFVDPWPGGWWRLRDIVDDQIVCMRAFLTLSARYREMFRRNHRAMALDAIDRGRSEPPYAWVVPSDQPDPGRAAEMVRTLAETGIDVRWSAAGLKAGGVTYPPRSWVLPASQPHRAHLKDVMERQEYPSRFTASGAAEPPYDVAGWTLPLQMGVRALAVQSPPASAADEPISKVELPRGALDADGRADWFAIENRSNDDFIAIHALMAAGVPVRVATSPCKIGDRAIAPGTILAPAGGAARQALSGLLPTISTRARGVVGEAIQGENRPLTPRRVGLYRPWVPSMDEGWTRLVFERFRVPFASLTNADLRAGDLGARVDLIVFPSIEAGTLRNGFAPAATEPPFVGGIGVEGAEALRAFVDGGGTVVGLEDSCHYLIEALKLPVSELLKGLPTSGFYGPGSIVRVVAGPDGGGPLTTGMPASYSAYFDKSLAFELKPGGRGRVVARYAEDGPLESGWLLGPEKIRGKAAILDIPPEHPGGGRVVLFAFPPQHRGQTHGTFRLLLNALVL